MTNAFEGMIEEFPHGTRMKAFGYTVAPVRLPQIKELVDVTVDERIGMYTIWGTPNSADFNIGRIGDRVYIDVRMNPHNLFQFHPEELPFVLRRIQQDPFLDEFGGGARILISDRDWEKHYKRRYEKYHEP